MIFKHDCFHTLKHGFGREVAASVILQLGYMCYFDYAGDLKNLPARLSRAFSLFKLWCCAEGKYTILKQFTKANLHTAKGYPFLGGKGSDCTLAFMWLQFFIPHLQKEPKNETDRVMLEAMLQVTEGLCNFIGITHSHPMWLPPSCVAFLHQEGLKALRGYAFCARVAATNKKRFFGLKPKYHYFAHMVFQLRDSLAANPEAEVLSPITYNCEGNEDFIGRVASISRAVNTRAATKRTMQRYGLSFAARLRRISRVHKTLKTGKDQTAI